MPETVFQMRNGTKRVIRGIGEELRVAEVIMRTIIVPELQNNPDLDLCKIKMFCDEMQSVRYPQDENNPAPYEQRGGNAQTACADTAEVPPPRRS